MTDDMADLERHLAAVPVADRLGDLCGPCRSRQFVKLGGDRRADERLEVIDGLLTPIPDPMECRLCQGACADLPMIVELATEEVAGYEFARFGVGSLVDEELLIREEDQESRMPSGTGEPLKTYLNRTSGRLLEATLDSPWEPNSPELVIHLDFRFAAIRLESHSVCFEGRYRKVTGTIPQTRWPCRRCQGNGGRCQECAGSGKRYPTSVEEQIGIPLLLQTGAKDHAFHGMGREDIDARMLGTGRPFVIELKEPKLRTIDIAALQARLAETAMVEVHDLHPVPKARVAELKNAAPDKSYLVKVESEEDVDPQALAGLEETLTGTMLAQRTPERVSHRRADKIRERQVRWFRTTSIDARHFTAEIRVESGTYIKELISGDQGRTVPNVSDLLGNPARVVSLDVTAVHDGDI